MELLKTIFNFLKETQILAVIVGFILGATGNEYIRQWLFSPEIKIGFQAEEPFVIKSRKGDDRERIYYPFYQFRLSIFNNSKFFKADNHVVMLTGLWNKVDGGYEKEKLFEPIRLTPLGYGPETILPKMSVLSPFGRIGNVEYQKRFEASLLSGDPNEPQFRFEMMDMPRWILSHVSPGKHRFEITVYFDNIPPVSEKFELSWSGRWKDDFNEMLKEIVIKAI